MSDNIIKKIYSYLETVSAQDLLQFKESLEQIIQRKFQKELGRRRSRRAKVKIPAFADIEREAEFFNKSHNITIRDLSTHGMCFTTNASVIHNDILAVTFRSPYSGERKRLNCQALRVKEKRTGANYEYEVGAQAVGKEVVRAYRDMLKNRGRN